MKRERQINVGMKERVKEETKGEEGSNREMEQRRVMGRAREKEGRE